MFNISKYGSSIICSPHGLCRKIKSLDSLRREKMAVKAKLEKEELLGLSLYTV
jgi:hypothetical protein